MATREDSDVKKRKPRSILTPQPGCLRVVKQRAPLSRQDQASYAAIVNQLTHEKKPGSPRETALIGDIALNYVRLQSVRRLETETLDGHIEALQEIVPEPMEPGLALAMVFMQHGNELESIQRKQEVIQNVWYRAMRDLDREQTARRKNEKLNRAPVPAHDPKSKRIHLVQTDK
jgi:hypothetical protein